MKKTTFTPSPDQLEGRIVLSGGPKFSNGAAILTEKALGQTYGLIQKAFGQYMNHGQDSNRLQGDLANAVNRIPYNRRDGLLAAVQSEASQMVTDVRSKASVPVKGGCTRPERRQRLRPGRDRRGRHRDGLEGAADGGSGRRVGWGAIQQRRGDLDEESPGPDG